MELDAGFHLHFAEFLRNGEILRVMVRLREKMRRVVNQVFRICPTRVEGSYEEHSAIAAAVIDGDDPGPRSGSSATSNRASS